jgi:hypothetical protein
MWRQPQRLACAGSRRWGAQGDIGQGTELACLDVLSRARKMPYPEP